MTETIFSFGNFVPLIVGSIFFAIGINFIFHFLRFRALARRVTGRVKLIEKYIGYSKSTSSNGTTATTYYRPVVEYSYQNETRTVSGLSVSQIRHALHQSITVLLNISDDGKKIQAKVDDSLNLFIGALFAMAGFIALCVFVVGIGGSWIVATAITIALTAIGYNISGMMLNFNDAFDSKEDQWVQKKDSTLIETKAEFRKEVSLHNLIAFICGIFLFIVGSAIMYSAYNGLSSDALNMVLNDLQSFWENINTGGLTEADEKSLTLFGTGSFMFIIAFLPVFKSARQARAAMRI